MTNKEAFISSYSPTKGLRPLDLKNIWKIMDVRPFEVFVQFFNPNNHRRPRIRDFFEIIWKMFEINEKGKKDFFSEVEKLKILDWHVF